MPHPAVLTSPSWSSSILK